MFYLTFIMKQIQTYPEYPINEYRTIQNIVNELKDVLSRESKRPETHQHLTSSMQQLIEYEIIPMITTELDYDPTPQYLYDNDGGEAPVTAAEMHQAAWVQHQELHN